MPTLKRIPLSTEIQDSLREFMAFEFARYEVPATKFQEAVAGALRSGPVQEELSVAIEFNLGKPPCGNPPIERPQPFRPGGSPFPPRAPHRRKNFALRSAVPGDRPEARPLTPGKSGTPDHRR
jgi:hypothetical protein